MVERMALTLAVDVQQGHVSLCLLRLEILHVVAQPGKELALGLRMRRLKVLSAADCGIQRMLSRLSAFVRQFLCFFVPLGDLPGQFRRQFFVHFVSSRCSSRR